MRETIREILDDLEAGSGIEARGWVRTKRETKETVFLEVNDGSCMRNLQCVFVADAPATDELAKATTGASVAVSGTLVASPAAGQRVELKASSIRVLGEASPETYPLQKKAHGFDFLRQIAHLRPRTNTFGAVARVRSQMSWAVHSFFAERSFQYVHTPLITASDCEGAGQMFQVTTLDLDQLARQGGTVDYSRDFFGKKAFLTVSGQLEVETHCCGLGRTYTFGPTFRAENSNTTRHLAEFWMIEPEVAFAELDDDIALAEDFIKHLLRWALDKCREDLEFFDSRIQKGLIASLEGVADAKFGRITYTDAISELAKHADRFEYKPEWGGEIQTEHEKFLSETVFGGPVAVTDYPKEIKSFYMRLNDDGKTVRAMDMLVPRLGEIIGGSEREWRYDVLTDRMRALGLREEDYWWYLDLRKFGSVPHSGFGLGFERLLLYLTGMQNIRDVIPFPRAAGQAEF